MKKEKKEKTIKDRLEVGDKIFYYDGLDQWDIETVESVNKPEKLAILSNNAHISRYPKADGTFQKLNPTRGILPDKQEIITLVTEDNLRLRTAIMARKRITNYLSRLEHSLLKTTDLKDWERWTSHKQDQLICMAAHIARGIEEAEIEEEDIKALATSLGEPVEKLYKPKRKKK